MHGAYNEELMLDKVVVVELGFTLFSKKTFSGDQLLVQEESLHHQGGVGHGLPLQSWAYT